MRPKVQLKNRGPGLRNWRGAKERDDGADLKLASIALSEPRQFCIGGACRPARDFRGVKSKEPAKL